MEEKEKVIPIRPGARVWCKIGGPVMYVKRFVYASDKNPEDKWQCQWFAGDLLQTGYFLVETITTKDPNTNAGPEPAPFKRSNIRKL